MGSSTASKVDDKADSSDKNNDSDEGELVDGSEYPKDISRNEKGPYDSTF